jgi:hypothetical protein
LTEQTGQLIEVERSTDYGVKTMLVWPKARDKTITQMLKSALYKRKIKRATYMNSKELEKAINGFLPQKPIVQTSGLVIHVSSG